MHFVPVKNQAQQYTQVLHRLREQLVKSRTGLANQARALLGEYGIVARSGIAKLRRLLAEVVSAPAAQGGLRGLICEILAGDH